MLLRIMVSVLIVMAGQMSAQQAADNVIHVDVDGLRNGKGQVACSLYASADGYPKNDAKAVAHAKSAIANGRATCDFTGLQPGLYAVALYHDENSNGKLDTNFMGIPREGVGASNNAKGHFGPPKFEDAAFHFTGGRLDLKITLFYI